MTFSRRGPGAGIVGRVSGYDEWAAARTPALVRFAHALVAGPAADAAVRRALDKLASRWPQVATRDEPDLVARAHVVAAVGGGQATRRRAAALLRLLEDRTDAEIADVLRCSESAARRHVARGLAAEPLSTAGAGGGLPSADRTASSVQVLTRPTAQPTTQSAPGRRRGGAWAGALAVLALVGGIAWTDHVTSTPQGVITYPHVAVPSDWRVESYAGVEVRVPVTWGFGGSPVRSDSFDGRHLGGCGANEAAVLSSADHAAYASSVTPFVGRPAVMTSRCVPWGSDGIMPRTEAVWFASPLAVGVKDVGSQVAETRAVGGQKVTVFASDSALRRKILGTATVVSVDGNGCPTRAVQQPTRGPEGLEPSSMSVCVYSEDPGTPVLMWSGHTTEPAARSYADAVTRAAPVGACPGLPHGRWLALGLHGQGGTRWDVVDLGCGAIVGAGGSVALTVETVQQWGLDGVGAYAPVPAGLPPSVAQYFHPAG